jgi:thymidylate synthase
MEASEMRVFQSFDNVATMLAVYEAVWEAPEEEIRGMRCRNLRNAALVLDGAFCPLTSFRARNLNLAYAKKEWLWYLGGDRFDDSIERYATMWKKLKQPDGSYYSNYGQYLFEPDSIGLTQFDYVVNALRRDEHSRRASMVLLKREHLFESNSDVVCTYAINFAIQNGELHMTVMMRSNDVIFGFTNDAFCFWNLFMFVWRMTKAWYPDLEIGEYTHFANSLHLYERHYEMAEQLVEEGEAGHEIVAVPIPTLDEVSKLIFTRGQSCGNSPYLAFIQT